VIGKMASAFFESRKSTFAIVPASVAFILIKVLLWHPRYSKFSNAKSFPGLSNLAYHALLSPGLRGKICGQVNPRYQWVLKRFKKLLPANVFRCAAESYMATRR
jgi:hypothetical protein